MNTNRLFFRNRTRELIREMLTYSKEEQMLFFGFSTNNQLEYKLKRIQEGLSKENVDYQIFDLIEKKNKTVIGSCGFHKWNKEHSRSEIGYEIHKEYQNQGYMSEAIKEVINYGFKKMNLNRIEALIDPTNENSIRIVEKNGFKREGILRGHYKNGNEFEDSIMYALIKSDYNF
ncbi:MAG: GNAT family protein [Lutibacter sp.]|uniref:GNAT family N-acetyltransferase n=1 Tax=Lutibacter sp. TaxID=1925666 RepID=UPI00299D8A76|nr:GNAT family protein [Lutibacter sp.]MDX1828669.1 GNAT family protein [Lutibacter sp.]